MQIPRTRTINCKFISSAGLISVGWASDAGQTDGIFTERGADLCTEGCNGDKTDHSDQPDQHTIFHQGRPVLVPGEAVDQFAHPTLLSKVLYRAERNKERGVERWDLASNHVAEPFV